MDDATLELRLADGDGMGIDVCDLRIDLGGDREKSTGETPYSEDESSPLLSLDSDAVEFIEVCVVAVVGGVASKTELVASSRSLDCCAMLGRWRENLLPMMAPVWLMRALMTRLLRARARSRLDQVLLRYSMVGRRKTKSCTSSKLRSPLPL